MIKDKNKQSRLHKRIVSACVIAAMLVTSVPFRGAETAAAVNNKKITVTDAQIVCENFHEEVSFTDEEADLLSSGYVQSKTYTLAAPAEENQLVAVDTDKKQIAAKDYTDAYEHVWEATEALVSTATSSAAEVVTMEDGHGRYITEGKDYKIEVVYKTKVKVDNQKLIANMPYYLAKGMNNMDVLVDCSANLILLETYLPNLMSLVNGSAGQQLPANDPVVTAIKGLNSQMDANAVLDMTSYYEDYDFSESKVKYLLENGDAARKCIEDTYKAVQTISDSTQLQETISKLTNTSLVRNLNRAKQQCATLAEKLKPVCEDTWKILTKEAKALVKLPTATEDQKKLDALVEAVVVEKEHSMAEREALVAATTVLNTQVNRYDVEVQVQIKAIPKKSVDSNELAELAGFHKTVMVPANATKAEVLEAIFNSGLEKEVSDRLGEEADIACFEYMVNGLGDTLTGDTACQIVYMPKTYSLTFAYDQNAAKKVYYGYHHTLESADNPERMYEYAVGDKMYSQGEIITVTGDVMLSRTETKAKASFTLAQLVAESYSKELTEKELAILGSEAIRSESVKLRVVDDKESSLITVADNQIKAANYESGYNGLSWVPVSAGIYKENAVVEEVAMVGNVATIQATDYDHIQVTYEIVVKGENDQDVMKLLNLAHTLVDEAAKQKEDLDQLADPQVYDNLGEINKTMLNSLKGNLGEESQDAIEYVKAHAYNEEGKLYLYEYVKGYKENGLIYYYQDENYKKIKNQVAIIAPQLKIIAEDPLLPSVLEDLNYGEYKDKIDDAVKILEEANSRFVPVNEAVDTGSSQLGQLVKLIETDAEVREYKANDGVKLTKAIMKDVTEGNEPTETPGPTVTPGPTDPGQEILYGDVDSNNEVNLADAQRALKYALKIIDITEEQKLAADVNCDSNVNLADAQLILKYALKIIAKLPQVEEP